MGYVSSDYHNDEGSGPGLSPNLISQSCFSPCNSGSFADSMNRKAFRDGIKPGWHYFGRKMVSEEGLGLFQDKLVRGQTELLFLLLTHSL